MIIDVQYPDSVVMPCACGGYVAASRRSPARGLITHYREPVHRESVWGLLSAENDAATFADPFEAHPEWPTAGRSFRDLSGEPPRASAAPGGKP